MADTPFPLPRELRQTGVLSGDGTSATYGPFAFKCFDTADILVLTRPAGQSEFAVVSATVAKVSNLPQDFFTVTFPAALPASTAFVVASQRLHERTVGITRGQQLDPAALEKELSKQGTVLQELRRDFGRAFAVPFGQVAPSTPGPEEDRVLGWRDGLLANFDPEDFVNAAGVASAAQGAKADTALQPAEAFPNAVRYGAVGNYNPTTDTGTDNSTAFASALAVCGAMYLPAGNYYVSSSSVHRTIEASTIVGPGRVWGPYFGDKRVFGKNSRMGVASTEVGNELPGGWVVGGENGKGIRGWAQSSMWMQIQPEGAGMPVQFQIYSSSLFGVAAPVSGTNRLIASTGVFSLTPDWAGGIQLVRAGDLIGFGDQVYKIASRVSDTEITVTTESGGAVSFSGTASKFFRHVYEYSYGKCNVSGTAVTAVGDRSFDIGVSEAGQSFLCIAGTWYAATINSTRSATLATSGGTQTAAAFVQKSMDPHRSSTIFRNQGAGGAFEENFALCLDIKGRALFDMLGHFGGTNMVFRADGSYDGSGSEEHFFMGRDGKFALGKGVDPAYNGRLESYVYNASALTIGGTSRSDFQRLRGFFGSADTRLTDFYQLNDFFGLSIQSKDEASTYVPLSLSPLGGGVSIGYRGDPLSAGMTLGVAGVIGPRNDNTYSLGTSGQRFSTVYAATGTINTSDARAKTEIRSSELGLDFINALEAVSFRFKSGGQQEFVEEIDEEVTEPETRAEDIDVQTVEIVDGQAVRRTITQRVDVPVHDELPVVDADGNPVIEMVPGYNPDGTAMRDDTGAQIRVPRQKVHRVQRMKTVIRKRQVVSTQDRPGSRRHFGLIAQQVKSALDAAGVEDFAGWTLADANAADSLQGLRMDQFIAPLIKAVQELSARVAALEADR